MDTTLEIFQEEITENEIEYEKKSYYDNEEISYFYESEYKPLINRAEKYYKFIYLFLFETAARISEALDVKIKDINFEMSSVKIRTSKQRSMRKTRVLTISEKLQNLILLYQRELGLDNEDFIFAKAHLEGHVSTQSVQSMMIKDCKKLGIERKKAHPHTWRHTRAIELLNNGLNIVQVQRVLGHTSIASTLIYLKYSNNDVREATRNANKAIGLE
ncbi:MAG: site-specific integrase [Brevinematales bacterium]|jgi:integrase